MSSNSLSNTLAKKFSPTHKKLVEIIYRSEIKAPQIGISITEILKRYTNEMKINPKNKNVVQLLNSTISQLEKGRSRSSVYKEILTEDIILFMKEAEKKNVPPSMIFEKYAPIKAMGDKAVGDVRRKLMVPIVIFFLAVAGLNYMISIFYDIRADGVIEFGAAPDFILDHFIAMNLSLGGLFIYLFLIIPEKMPMLKKVFSEIDGMLALSTMEVFDSISYSAGEMIAPIRRQFKLKINIRKKDVNGLISLLYQARFINDLQAAEIKIETERGFMEKAISVALSEKKNSVEGINETIKEIIGNISMLLLAPPLLMAITVLLGMMMAATKLM